MSILSAVQMCSSGNVDTNLKLASQYIRAAAANGAKMVVLPEMFACIGKNPVDALSIKEKFGSGKIQDFISSVAAQCNIWIVAGTIPIACENSTKVSAACIVFDANGNAVARYDKMHLFDAIISEKEAYKESDTTEPGSNIVVVDTPLGRLGLAVCYDIRFPALFTALRNRGAEIIAIPAAFTVKTGEAHWKILLQARAVENFCFLVAACQGGSHASGRKTYGHSMIIEPWGTVLQEVLVSENPLIYAEIDLKKLYEIRKLMPVHQHQKIKLDFSQ
ncbi:MAG: hypothetical protein A3F13_01370 [Gammaproteobacteria bacterium RIFCSPHIGHO2_12_FULL_40_19]|nr:MAG: hypothetical protein A3F13_01370 [Gammaproteobacteria bacterium RIFCSPHIGHO2_12_FULL_40_19]